MRNSPISRSVQTPSQDQDVSNRTATRVWSEFFLEVLQLAIIHNFLKYKDIDKTTDVKAQCGIPIVDWINIFMFTIIFRTFGGLLKVYTMMSHPKNLKHVEGVKLFLIDGITLGWIAYGTALFTSELNDCGKIKGTQGFYRLMMTFLIVGYLMITAHVITIASISNHFNSRGPSRPSRRSLA